MATLEDFLAISYKLSILLLYNLAIMLFGIYPSQLKTYAHAKACT